MPFSLPIPPHARTSCSYGSCPSSACSGPGPTAWPCRHGHLVCPRHHRRCLLACSHNRVILISSLIVSGWGSGVPLIDAKDTVAMAGKVRYELPTRRRDGTVSSAAEVNLPSPSASFVEALSACWSCFGAGAGARRTR
jgi:hypothetical protein